MATYRVGSEPLETRQSMRQVLCEQCGKNMGTALFSRDYQGITAEKAIELWPYLKVDFTMHESQCPSGVGDDQKQRKDQLSESLKMHFRE